MLPWLALLLPTALCASVTVNTESGPIVGTSSDSLGNIFLGVPYATPPLGDLRFAAPEAHATWSTPLDCTEQKAGCIQECTLPDAFCPPSTSEDCLFLNIYTPHGATPGSVPVMVFIHGGNFRQGYNGGDLMDLQALANKVNAVFVVPQYRMGAMGFLYTSLAGIKGNFGILDQRMALQWVQNNIKNFGGDPGRVTLTGQSAGGCSTMIHMLDDNAKGLFHQAMVQSSACVSLPLRSPLAAESLGAAFMSNVSCSSLKCLRAKTAQEVLDAQLIAANKIWTDAGHLLELFQPFEPTYGTDDTTITEQPLDMIHAGNFPHVPLLAGAVTDEAVPFVYSAFKNPMPSWEARTLLDVVFGLKTANKLPDLYPITNKEDAREWVIQIVSDFLFTCPTRNMTQVFAKAGLPAFMYRYAHVSPEGPAVWGKEYKECWDRACHAAEIPFYFDTVALITGNITAGEAVLQDQMSSYLGNYIHGSSPNEAGDTSLPEWPAQGDRPVDLHLDATETIATTAPDYVSRGKYCDFWDSVGYHTPSA